MRLRISVMGILCLGVSSVAAQEFLKDTTRLEEVVVTEKQAVTNAVSKLPVPLSMAPLSVSQVSAQEISTLSFQSLMDVARNVTGVRPNNTYGGFQSFNIRGFNTFVVVTDGIRDERHNLYASAPNTSLASIESIEVLKGAASVMYGHSALGGIISLTHKQPTPVTQVNAQMSIGSWGRYGIQAGAGGNVCKGVDFRTDFSMNGGDGWRHTNDRNYNAYLALNFTLSDYDRINFSVSAKNDRYGTDTGQPHLDKTVYRASDGRQAYEVGDLPEGFDRRTRYNDPLDHLNDKDLTVAAKWTHRFKNPDWNLSEYLSYYYDDLDYYASEKLTYLTSSTPEQGYDYYYMNGDQKTYINLGELQRVGYQFAYKVSLLQNQLELKGKFNTGNVKHNVLGGYSFASLYTPRYTANYASDATGPGKNSHVSVVNPVLNQGNVYLPYSKRNLVWEYMHGIYVQDYLNVTDKLSALLSLRYDRFNRTYQQAYTDDREVTSKDAKAHIYDNALTYRFSLLYQFTDAVNLYASTSSYFKPTRTVASPGYLYVGSDGKVIEPDGKNVFDPEKGYQYEVGSHIAFSDKFQADVAAFYILKKNTVESNIGTTEDGLTVSGQVGKTDSKGLEVEIHSQPCKQVYINAGYTFTVAKIKEYAANDYAKNTLAGNYVNLAPKHMAYGWLFYDFDRALKGLKLGAGFNYSDKAYVNTANTLQFDAYAIAHVLASYSFKNWRLQLNVNNLFDKTYYLTSVNTIGFIPEEGRNVRFTVAFNL